MSTKTIIQFLLFISMSLGAIAIGVNHCDKKMIAPRPKWPNFSVLQLKPPPLNVSGDWEGKITRVFRDGSKAGVYLKYLDPKPEECTHYWTIESATGDSYRV